MISATFDALCALFIPRTSAINDRKLKGVISPYAGAPSGKYPIQAFASIGLRLMSWPDIVTVPAVGVRKPVIIFIEVDFPAPFGPRKPKTSPLFTEREILSTALSGPNDFVSPVTSISVSANTVLSF